MNFIFSLSKEIENKAQIKCPHPSSCRGYKYNRRRRKIERNRRPSQKNRICPTIERVLEKKNFLEVKNNKRQERAFLFTTNFECPNSRKLGASEKLLLCTRLSYILVFQQIEFKCFRLLTRTWKHILKKRTRVWERIVSGVVHIKFESKVWNFVFLLFVIPIRYF